MSSAYSSLSRTRTLTRTALVAAALATGGLVGAMSGTAQAAPFAPAPAEVLASDSGIVAVHGWGHHHGWGHRHHGWHRGPRWGWRHHHHHWGWGHRHGWRHHGWRHHHRW